MKSSKEIWKDIDGYEGLYQVSTLGNVKGLDRWCNKNHYKEKVLKTKISNTGYYLVGLCKNKKSSNKTVHRLVARAFIPNPNNKPCINHIDGNKKNNNIDNLEWCDYSHNLKEAYRLGLKLPPYNNLGKHFSEEHKNKISKAQKGKINKGTLKRMKKVFQFTTNMEYIRTYESSYEANRITNIPPNCITACCNGIRNKAGGYIWKYTKKVSLDEIE